jgi:protoheme IX farnesyltransferase
VLNFAAVSPHSAETSASTPWIAELAATTRDLIETAKPRITTMVVFTTAIGLWLAPGSIGTVRAALLFLGTAMLVASANMLNGWYERDTDALMLRTRQRPIPAGRLDPWSGFAAALALGAFSIPLLALAINPLTALLGLIAHASYVWAYTPLKRVTPLALEVGAIPGAIPPLMGWTAGTGALGVPGWFLFGILFFWQLPHFLAIAIYLEEDYRRGGLDVLTVRRGALAASRRVAIYTAALVAVSLLAQPLGIAGVSYTVAATVFGAGFLAFAVRGLSGTIGGAWARRTMLYSIVWLTAVLAALVIDAR